MKRIFRRFPLAAFFALAFIFSWSAFGLAFFAETAMGPLLILGGFGPLAAGFFVSYILGGEEVSILLGSITKWRFSGRLWAFTLGVPPLLYLAAGLILALVVSVEISSGSPSFALYPLMIGVVAVIGGGQEEVGWRGFALPRLQERFDPVVAGAMLGVIWVLWHLPLFAMAGSQQSSIPLLPYAAYTVGFSIIMTWLYNATGGSVLAAILFHAGANVPSTWYPLALCAGGINSAGLLAVLVWVVVILLVFRGDGHLETAEFGRRR